MTTLSVLVSVTLVICLVNVPLAVESKEFFFSVPGGNSVKEVSLLAYTDNATSSSLSIESINGTVHSSLITSDESISISLDWVVDGGDSSLVYKGLRAFTDDDSMSLAMLILTQHSSDSFLIYPYTSNDMEIVEYILLNYNNDIHCQSEVLLVGTMNNTQVYSNYWNGTVDEFQTVTMLQSTTSCSSVSGTIITSTETISVISSCICDNGQIFQVEQIPPSYAWGRKYVIPVFIEADRVCLSMIAALHSTVANITCSNEAENTVYLNRTEAYSISNLDSVCSIVSDSPLLIIVAIYRNSTPVSTLVPSVEQSPSSVYIRPFPCNGSGNVSASIGIFSSSSTFDILANHITLNNYTTTHNQLHYASSNTVINGETILATTDEEAIVMSMIFSSQDGCVYSHPCAYELKQLPVINVTFNQPLYEVFEQTGIVVFEIERECVQCGIKTRMQITSNELPLNIQIEFRHWETRMEVSIPLSDDDAFEEDRQVTIAMDSIRNGVELLNFYPIPQLRILIKDNDYMNIGIRAISFNDRVLAVSYGVTEGQMSPSTIIRTTLTVMLTPYNDTSSIGTSVIIYEAWLTNAVSRITVDVTPEEEYDDPLSIFTVTLTTTTSNSLLTINPGVITDSIFNITESASSDDTSSYFIVGDFTSQSLLVTTCLVGGLTVLLAIVVFISVTVCIAFARYGRRWTASGTINRMFLHDDGISLATNDPDTYELMNKLGEKKTARLTINDDNAYSVQ